MIRLIWSPFHQTFSAPKLARKLPIRLGGLVHVAHSGPRFMLVSAAAKILDDSRPSRIRKLSLSIWKTRADCPGQSMLIGAGAALSLPFRFSGRCRRVPVSGIGVIIYRCRRIRLSGFNVFFVFFDGFGVVDSDVEKFASHKQIYWCFFVLHMDIPFMPLFLGELVAHPPTGRAERRG